jgi:hypothetical protein
LLFSFLGFGYRDNACKFSFFDDHIEISNIVFFFPRRISLFVLFRLVWSFRVFVFCLVAKEIYILSCCGENSLQHQLLHASCFFFSVLFVKQTWCFDFRVLINTGKKIWPCFCFYFYFYFYFLGYKVRNSGYFSE